ncbi:LysM peptidoglycan-binding domain-containing protein [Sporobolomyces salmoneus]|uniref:LysM peptidoglycan-binding domain-containing protein n=1 Tax=Sporobolomyces salmoneus TaxID=183962 RepID=UPI003173AF29
MLPSSPTPSSSSTLHPLHSLPSTSTNDLPQSSSSSRAPSPAIGAVRSRKPPTPSSPFFSPSTPAPHPNLLEEDDSADVTRPSLRKATKDALGLAGQGSSTKRTNDSKGKGKEREQRTRAASEGLTGIDYDREREVVVHKVLKTDTIASVSLQYDITQQALRKANRLWATDPIHLRPTLLIPLDECNLPSSSFGLERIAREENGDITVWRRDDFPSSASSSSQRSEREGLGLAAGRSEREHQIVSPKARRLISTSSFETSPNPQQQPSTTSTNDFLSIWDDAPASSRPSLDSVRSSTSSYSSPNPRGRQSSFSPYQSSNHDPYSSSNASLELPPPLPPNRHHSYQPPPPLIPLTPDYSSQASLSFSPAPSTSSLDTTPPTDPGSLPNNVGPNGILSKRTLKVERLPASQLSFFPPPNPNNPTSPTRPGIPSTGTTSRSPAAQSPQKQREESEDLFFGPLANTLTTSFPSLRNLNKYLPSSFTVASTSASSSSNGSGSIALPLSRTESPKRDRTRTSSSNGARGSNRGGWNLDYFGGEEEQAALVLGGGGGGGDSRNGRSSDSRRKRNGTSNGQSQNSSSSLEGYRRRVGEIGLEQVSGLAPEEDSESTRTIQIEQNGEARGFAGGKKTTNRMDVRDTFGLI